MNPNFHFVLAMDVIVCTAGMGNILWTSVCMSPDSFGDGSVMTDPVIMPAKEEHGCDSGSESLDNMSHVTSCIVMLKDVINVLLLQKGQNDRIREHFMDQCVYESRQFW
jgi:hypothetical protein